MFLGRLSDAIGLLNVLVTKRPTNRVRQYALMLKSNALILNAYPSICLTTASYAFPDSEVYKDADQAFRKLNQPHFVWAHGRPVQKPRVMAELLGRHQAHVTCIGLSEDRQLLYSGG